MSLINSFADNARDFQSLKRQPPGSDQIFDATLVKVCTARHSLQTEDNIPGHYRSADEG